MGSRVLRPLSYDSKAACKSDLNSSRCSERKVCTHCRSGSPSALRKDSETEMKSQTGKGGGQD